VFREATVEIIAEDLGTVPDFVRASLAEHEIPGFRVLRWERHWKALGQPYRDPSEYPPLSVAASGTHDTETLSEWWNGLPISERALIAALPTILRITGGRDIAASAYGPEIGATLIEALNASGSDLLLMPIQDVFGWTDRINDPSVIDDYNWRFRLPWPCDRWDEQPQARQCQAMLRRLAEQYGRLLLPR
jgi:4-alpha-glucanotransferase